MSSSDPSPQGSGVSLEDEAKTLYEDDSQEKASLYEAGLTHMPTHGDRQRAQGRKIQTR